MLVLIVLLAAGFFLAGWGLRRHLPLLTDVDEPFFVKSAVGMAARASLNPGQFNHPGSTIIYPMAASFRLWYSLSRGGPLWGAAPDILVAFRQDNVPFYLLGRMLAVAYGILSVWAAYLVGRRISGRKISLLGAWWSLLCPYAVLLAQLVRPDSACAFFGLIGLWACLRMYQRCGWQAQVIAGAAIGLAVATRYSLIPLLGVYVLANLFLLVEGRREPRRLAGEFVGGLGAACLAFLLVTPFLLVELKTALANIRFERRLYHLGHDGLSPLGNLRWYLGTAIPQNLGWPRTLLATAAVIRALAGRRREWLLLASYPVFCLAGLSFHSQFWGRYVLPAAPVISLLAAWTTVDLIGRLTGKFRRAGLLNGLFLAAAVAGISCVPTLRIIRMNIRRTGSSTQILAREWVSARVPAGAVIARERETAPLKGLPHRMLFASHLPDRPFEDYLDAETRYFLVSDQNYLRYFAEPERYAAETAIYRRLFDEGILLREFAPSATVDGPTVRIYEWNH
ncbi:MAG: glycosyltransferase family 39 protein [Candidatus Erginobacter occultus]|nr:glycosyltransferase family 39 protein [Candidatus Erginobacter occultus]